MRGLIYLYCLPNDIPVIKWRRMRLAGHVARVGERKGGYRVIWRTGGGRKAICNRNFKEWD
jgi:hypothetical protein